MARKQLQEIRRLNRESTRNFEWHGIAGAGVARVRGDGRGDVRGVRGDELAALRRRLDSRGGLMFKVGAPLFAIVLGVALAALLSWLTRRPDRR